MSRGRGRSPHGMVNRYVNEDHCRCAKCRSANTAYVRSMRAARHSEVAETGLPPTVEHGSSAYDHWGCRCAVCCRANTVRQAQGNADRRAYVAEHGLPSTTEHGLSAYRNWGCRCGVCTQANTDESYRYYYARRVT